MKRQEILHIICDKVALILSEIEPNERIYILDTLIFQTYCFKCGEYVTECSHDEEF
jgi:hypothetical protein